VNIDWLTILRRLAEEFIGQLDHQRSILSYVRMPGQDEADRAPLPLAAELPNFRCQRADSENAFGHEARKGYRCRLG